MIGLRVFQIPFVNTRKMKGTVCDERLAVIFQTGITGSLLYLSESPTG